MRSSGIFEENKAGPVKKGKAMQTFFILTENIFGHNLDRVINVLLLLLLLSIFEILRLRRLLRKEKARALVPILILELDPKDLGLYLKNKSAYPAKDIVFDRLWVQVLTDFTKRLTFAFDPVDFLNSQERVRLNYKVFDGQYPIGPSESSTLVPHLSQADFELRLRYANMANVIFNATLMNKKQKVGIKEILPGGKDLNLC